jgi:hypothetical protein
VQFTLKKGQQEYNTNGADKDVEFDDYNRGTLKNEPKAGFPREKVGEEEIEGKTEVNQKQEEMVFVHGLVKVWGLIRVLGEDGMMPDGTANLAKRIRRKKIQLSLKIP